MATLFKILTDDYFLFTSMPTLVFTKTLGPSYLVRLYLDTIT